MMAENLIPAGIVAARAACSTLTDAQRVGLWTGADHENFTIGAASRLYYGAGNVVELPQLTFQAGLAVRMHRLGLSPLTPAC